MADSAAYQASTLLLSNPVVQLNVLSKYSADCKARLGSHLLRAWAVRASGGLSETTAGILALLVRAAPFTNLSVRLQRWYARTETALGCGSAAALTSSAFEASCPAPAVMGQ